MNAAPLAGVSEETPSKSHYFSWINNTNEGATQEHTEANLGFFQWMNEEYGMVLDIYAFDAGAVDAPNYYGSPKTRKFQSQFPNGFAPLAEQAKSFGGRLGVWLGPDGFGNSPEEEKERIDFLTSLCRDHNFQLFKMDAVCGQLRDEKQKAFIRLMKSVRKHSPDLILLNHRLNLGEAKPYATTFLWQGAETYIDVHMANSSPATHNRAAALSRGLPPELKRLAEDHGVCLSSCLDYWEDDLILQAFNRSMILAPQLYGSPWFLRDNEYPKLARIFNLHRTYRDILIKGMILPEETYGPNAVSRGDSKTRLITLRNLTWKPVEHEIALDSSIGIESNDSREVRLYHPYEEIIGSDLKATDSVKVTVHPFRSLLLLVTTEECKEPSLEKGPYRVVRDVNGSDIEIDKLTPIQLKQPWHRKLADLKPTDLPKDWIGLYEATCFTADNNALEVRSLERSGPTQIPAVQKARDAFVNQPIFTTRALNDAYMFDGDPSTVFDIIGVKRDRTIEGGALRIDFGNPSDFDVLRIDTQASDRTLVHLVEKGGVDFSNNLTDWTAAEELIQDGNTLNVFPPEGQWRYFRVNQAPDRVAEVSAWKNGLKLERNDWEGTNLFAHPSMLPAETAWSAKIKIDEMTPTSYLCVAVEGKHGNEGCYAALRIGDKLIGAPDRAISYPTNPWEYPVRKRDTGYTYYFPLDQSMLQQDIEVVLLGMKGGGKELKPSVWITARELPFTTERITINR